MQPRVRHAGPRRSPARAGHYLHHTASQASVLGLVNVLADEWREEARRGARFELDLNNRLNLATSSLATSRPPQLGDLLDRELPNKRARA